MELKVGQTITCIKDYVYLDELRFSEGKEYKIKEIYDKYICIIDNTMCIFYLYDEFYDFFTTEPPKKERYFIVFYETTTEKGNSSVSTKGQYLNHDDIIKKIAKSNNLKVVIITNIIELNQQDYESWNK